MATSPINPLWIVGGVIALLIFLNSNKSSCAAKKKPVVKAGERLFVPSLEYQQRTRPIPREEQIDLTANASRMFTVASSFRDTRKLPVGAQLRI